MLLKPQRVLCIAAHPDDEVLGPGATLAQLSRAGCEVHVLVLGEGVGARYKENFRPDEEVATLAAEMQAAADALGVTSHRRALPDNRFDSLDSLDVVQVVEELIEELQPDVVFTHHPGDLNIDHRITCNAVLTAARPLPEGVSRTIFAFETLSSTEWNIASNGRPFVPNWFQNVADGLEPKLRAMEAYQHELREWPHPRSLRGIQVAAQRWGMSVGLDAAEAFMLLRSVDRSNGSTH